MTILTDPAREYAELCNALHGYNEGPGDAFLAERFDVPAWSAEFFQIVFCILERADRLIELTGYAELDDDFKHEACQHIATTKQAFAKQGLSATWHNNGSVHLAPVNVQPIKMLSPMIRSMVSYPKLSDEDALGLENEVLTFITWLEEHQLANQDFIRQSLLDGLRQFSFRLSKTQWLGWGYTMQSLRDVIAAYKLLEGATPQDHSAPDAEAILKRGAAFLGDVFKKIGVAKSAIEGADFLLRAYGAINLIQHGTTVTGLLTHLNG